MACALQLQPVFKKPEYDIFQTNWAATGILPGNCKSVEVGQNWPDSVNVSKKEQIRINQHETLKPDEVAFPGPDWFDRKPAGSHRFSDPGCNYYSSR